MARRPEARLKKKEHYGIRALLLARSSESHRAWGEEGADAVCAVRAGRQIGWMGTRVAHTLRYVAVGTWEGGGRHVTLALYTVLAAVMRIAHMQVACKSMHTACSTVAVRSEARRLHRDGAAQ